MNVIVGGGWSGLAAAVELAHHGAPVMLIEAADHLGGRARRIRYRGQEFDNGQHILLGAYHELLYLLDVIGVEERDVFARRPLELLMKSRRLPELRLRLPALPAPLHLLAGIAFASGLGIGEKYRALRFCLGVRFRRPGPDCSVRTLLEHYRQPAALTERLWEPLCLATLNTTLDQASAEIFSRVLHDAFGKGRHDSDLLIPRMDLGAVLPDPARDFIESRGGRILLKQRAVSIEVGDDAVTGVTLANGERLPAQQVILALPPPACVRLLGPVTALSEISAKFARLGSAPICTVYFRYPVGTTLPFPMVGLNGSTAQWVFDLALAGRPGMIAVVISGPGEHMKLVNAALQQQIRDELAGFFPDWPAPLDGWVLREKRATFLADTGVNALRPGPATMLKNCWIAGDASATAYPATLEGAVRSGLACARKIMKPPDTLKDAW